MPKLIRVTTVPMSLKVLLRGQMKFMSNAGFDVIMISADGKELKDVIEYEKCPHKLIEMTREITPFKDLAAFWKFYIFFKKEKPDIVHSHTPKAGLLAMMAAKMAGVRIRIHTIAGLRFMTSAGITRSILIQMEKITGKAATHVWPNSGSLLQYVLSNKLVKPGKLELIGKGSSNGIDLKRFSRSALTIQEIEKVKRVIHYDNSLNYILSVGRIVRDKGIKELVHAFDILYKENKKLRLVLVGDFEEKLDPLDEQTMQLIKNHQGIVLAGWQDEVEYFMSVADLLVHASHREGFPNVLLQAGAMECPIVCSGIEGNIDVVDDKENGLIFTVRDEADLLVKLKTAIDNPGRMKEMASRLRKKIEDNFDRSYVHQQLQKRYNELLNSVK